MTSGRPLTELLGRRRPTPPRGTGGRVMLPLHSMRGCGCWADLVMTITTMYGRRKVSRTCWANSIYFKNNDPVSGASNYCSLREHGYWTRACIIPSGRGKKGRSLRYSKERPVNLALSGTSKSTLILASLSACQSRQSRGRALRSSGVARPE